MMKRTPTVNRPSAAAARGGRLERGQALLIVAVSMIALVAFIGFTVDTGILFIANGHLRRAVDAAALSAATQFREGSSLSQRALAAKEFLALNNVDPADVSVSVDDCTTDTSLCTDPPRKFVRIRAKQMVQFVFLPIIGFGQFPITAEATSEAASIDAVIVIGGSETMAKESDPSIGYSNVFDPAQCNLNATINPNEPVNPFKCQPLWDAKTAAKAFVKQMYDGYDQVAVVTFAFKPTILSPLTANLGTDDTGSNFDSTGVYRAIDQIPIWDEASPPDPPIDPFVKIHGGANPLDFDCNFTAPGSCPGTPTESRSWLAGCSGCGMRVAANILKTTGRPSALWVIVFLSDGVVNMADMPVSFYSDAASRQGTILDAGINPTYFPNGYCGGNISGYIDSTQFSNNALWSKPFCVTGGHDLNGDGDRTDGDATCPYFCGGQSEMNFQDLSVRHCGPYNPGGAGTCPPGANYVGALGYTTTVTPTTTTMYYDALDYARDMVDQGALQNSANPLEPVAGTNMAIYSIGLGLAANPPDYSGEGFLRYMAAVGDDGDRTTDPCAGKPQATNCGNYYYAPSGAGLVTIFEDIAKRIFTRLTR